MKAVLLAGGRGTRLRPLTLHTPKPIVPIFNRPFLLYQIDLLRRFAEIDEVILSLNYQPRRIEDLFGDGSELGVRIRYVVEPTPLGTAGAVKYAQEFLTDSVLVFNGDVLTEVDLAAVVALHRERRARATIVLTPVDNPSAYGLVRTGPDGRVVEFIEKPDSDRVTCNTINAGIYVLEPDSFDRIPKDTAWSIERSFFPSLVDSGETFVGYVYEGYWIDIGTPAKYMQVHRDILAGRFQPEPFAAVAPGASVLAPDARVDPGARIEGPCFIDEGTVVRSGARVGPLTVLGRQCHVDEDAVVEGSILWPNTRVGREASVRDAILGRHCHVGRNATVDAPAILGDKSVVTDYSRV